MAINKNFGRVVGYNTIPANVEDNTAKLLDDIAGYVGDFVVDMSTSNVYQITAINDETYKVGDSFGSLVSGVDLSGYIPTAEKGEAGGVATLGDDGIVPSSQLPTDTATTEYVDEQIKDIDHVSAIESFFQNAEFSVNTDGDLIMTYDD